MCVSAASAHVKGALGRGYVPAAHALWLLVIYFFASLHFCALFYPRSPRIFFIYLDPLVAFYHFFYFLSLDYFWIWAIYLSRSPLFFLFFSFFLKVFRRLLKISKKRWPSRALSELTPTGQTAGKKSASGVQRASKFETTFAEATMAVTFSGCEIQHQPWPRPLSLMGPVIEKVDVLFLSRCAPLLQPSEATRRSTHFVLVAFLMRFLQLVYAPLKINKNTVFYHSLYLNNETKHTVQTWIFIIFYLLFFFDKTAST